ncbi:hypothetical protein TrVE_jg1980 [Triparma verrucosa]|uniref:ATP-dependent RNA helicase n=1 Tax=Triparma verrucosa TaxID=1606542 RepID=A0A9W7BHQ6_9STRA|nr:hypothetical protein TrVE_jg1980 [Triparma verrucosa]
MEARPSKRTKVDDKVDDNDCVDDANANAADVSVDVPQTPPTPPTPSSSLNNLLHPSLIPPLQSRYPNLLPLQSALLPHLLSPTFTHNPRDLILTSPTGSGKTLAFTLPLLNTLLKHPVPPALQCVIILPTVSLARQVYEDINYFTAKKEKGNVECMILSEQQFEHQAVKLGITQPPYTLSPYSPPPTPPQILISSPGLFSKMSSLSNLNSVNWLSCLNPKNILFGYVFRC